MRMKTVNELLREAEQFAKRHKASDNDYERFKRQLINIGAYNEIEKLAFILRV